jgi:hypothetical protein
LSKLVIEQTGGPVGLGPPLEAIGAFDLSHTVDEAGEVARILFHIWVDTYGPRGRTYGTVDGAGERIHLGRVYAEHVFQRPFAPPADRRVVRLAHASLPPVPPTRTIWTPAEDFGVIPDGATPIGELVEDPTRVVCTRA